MFGTDYGTNFRSPKVDVHQFSMIPKAQIPRSTFRMQHQHKTTFSASKIIPIYVQEILPGDTFNVSMTAFCRLSTPLYPIMDNMDLESWFFFVPNRIVWSHWVNFMGEQPSGPGDSIVYSIPQIALNPGPAAFSLYDYMGIPTAPQVSGTNLTINALPFRAYNMIWNQWFRDENINNSIGYGAANTVFDIGDGPDPSTNYAVQFVNKRHDYFTSCLPWTQKGATAITLPLGTSAVVKSAATQQWNPGNVSTQYVQLYQAQNTATAVPASVLIGTDTTVGKLDYGTNAMTAPTGNGIIFGNLYADLSTATAATINQIRLAFQTQRLLERDARGGTRYQEIIRSHFGVISPDARLQRPEILGSGKSPVNMAPVPQTTATGIAGTNSTPIGQLAGVGTLTAHNHGFRQSFTEHGYVIGLVAVRSDPVYQQGLRRLWTRLTRYDFYFPVFAMLGEQSVRNDELYCIGTTAQDTTTFGYQERWAEYRYFPSQVTGAFKSTYATPLDAWHLAQKFTSLPTLNSAFIGDVTNATLIRNLAAGSNANDQQFLGDFFFDVKCARPMPMYSVPGLIDHF